MEKKDKNQTVNTTKNQGKKTPVIIQLTDDDLESVVGAARCPPSTEIVEILPDK